MTEPMTVKDLKEILANLNDDDMIMVFDEGCATNCYETYYDSDECSLYIGC